jgi:cell division septum initiation protein DivIVA
MLPNEYADYVARVRFRRTLFGYHPDDVCRHLDVVSGWFSLAGLDELLNERMRELAEQGERRLDAAEREATQILADARREAAGIRRAAREERRAILGQARRQAALERRGSSRVGRPVGALGRPLKE